MENALGRGAGVGLTGRKLRRRLVKKLRLVGRITIEKQ
jgi:hypothetical protein